MLCYNVAFEVMTIRLKDVERTSAQFVCSIFLFVAEVNVAGVIPEIGMYGRIYGQSVYPPHKAIAFQSGCQASLRS
jgi:hypothetical protein